MNLGYVKTEFLDYQDQNRDLSGNEFPQAPRFTGSSGFTYAPSQGIFNGVVLNTFVVHESSSFSRPENTEDHRNTGHTLLNAKLGYQTDRGSLFLVGQNLTDEIYILAEFPAPAVQGRSQAGQSITYGGRRRIGLDLNLYF